jgi:hypothetical protein
MEKCLRGIDSGLGVAGFHTFGTGMETQNLYYTAKRHLGLAFGNGQDSERTIPD